MYLTGRHPDGDSARDRFRSDSELMLRDIQLAESAPRENLQRASEIIHTYATAIPYTTRYSRKA
eukprot:9482263-Pyramimonas_sp.AAC.1